MSHQTVNSAYTFHSQFRPDNASYSTMHTTGFPPNTLMRSAAHISGREAIAASK